jgi:hypothetical protein
LTDYEAAARGGCQCCQFLIEVISPYTGPGGMELWLAPGGMLEIFVKAKDQSHRYNIFIPIGMSVFFVFMHKEKRSIGELLVNNFKQGEKCCPWSAIGHGRLIAPISEVQNVVNVIKEWIADCSSNHAICAPQGPSILPKRLLDIQVNPIRLVETQDLPKSKISAYSALSHCWGTKELLKTTKETFLDHQKEVPGPKLSRTFQDAIQLTRELGLKYLWIDSLCIIQNDEEDWEKEATNMGTIYENAQIVLSAARAKDGSDGLFGARTPALIVAEVTSFDGQKKSIFESGHHKEVKFAPSNGEEFIAVVRDKPHHAQWDDQDMIARNEKGNPLLERAWAFQESLLAARLVHFAEHEMIFECKTGRQCECTVLDDIGPVMEPLRSVKHQFAAITIQPDSKDNALTFWHQVIEAYSARKLTFETDRMIALSSAAQRIEKIVAGTFAFGLFAEDIPRSLLWYAVRPGKRPVKAVRRDRVVGLPTWSWASVIPEQGTAPNIRYMSHVYVPAFVGYPHRIAETCAALMDRSKDAPTDDELKMFMNIFKAGYLFLAGPIITASLKIDIYTEDTMIIRNDASLMDLSAMMRKFEYTVIRGDQSNGFEPDIILHEGPHKMESGAEVHLMAVGRSVSQTHFENLLVLKRVNFGEDREVYERIGMMFAMKEGTKNWFDGAEKKPVIIV